MQPLSQSCVAGALRRGQPFGPWRPWANHALDRSVSRRRETELDGPAIEVASVDRLFAPQGVHPRSSETLVMPIDRVTHVRTHSKAGGTGTGLAIQTSSGFHRGCFLASSCRA